MAADAMTSRLLPVNFVPNASLYANKVDLPTEKGTEEANTGTHFRQHAFVGRNGKEVTVTPIIVDFRRLLQTRSSVEVVPGIANRDLLHAVVGLYDVSLSDMTPDVLYATVCERWARTVILLRDVRDTLEEMEVRRKTKAKAQKTEDIEKIISDSRTQDLNGHGPSGNTRNCVNSGEPDSSTNPAADSDCQASGDLECKKIQDLECNTAKDSDSKAETDVDTKTGGDSDDILECDEQKPGKFDDVFSDTDEETEECEDDDEEDFSKGIKTFLAAVAKRRETREKHEGELLPEHVGVENRLVAAATYKKAYCSKPSEKVIHLTLLAVRTRFRKWGIGKYLLQQVKDPRVVGQYDSVVVHADNDAVDFFQRYGFTDDTVLNNKWSELAEQFTNCTLMCYLPPFTGQTMLSDSVPELDIIAMEKEVKKWRQRAQEAYIAEMSCMNRMRHEIIHLRALVASQQTLVKSLMEDNEKLRKEKYILENEFLEYRLQVVKPSSFSGQQEFDDDDDLNTEQLLQDLEKEVERTARRKQMLLTTRTEGQTNRFVLSRNTTSEPYCHGRDTEEFYTVTEEFKEAMKRDMSVVNRYEVKMVMKAMLPQSVDEQIYSRFMSLTEPSMVARLYLCGSLEHPDRLRDILKNGFDAIDFSLGDYGKGLYFSKYPSKAAQFSAFGKLIVAEVGLGNAQTVVKKDRTRARPDGDFESIITPGRLLPSDSNQKDNMLCQEYVVFDHNQARPLYLIEYAPVGH